MTFQDEVTKDRTMRFRPLCALSGALLVAGVVGVTATSLFAQNSSSAASKPAAVPDAPASRMDFFAGYSYLGPAWLADRSLWQHHRGAGACVLLSDQRRSDRQRHLLLRSLCGFAG